MSSTERIRFGEADLSTCDREPIHIPGSIQPHGALLAVDANTREILVASANCGEILGIPAGTLLGKSILDFFPEADRIDEYLESPAEFDRAAHFALRSRFGGETRDFYVIGHRSPPYVVLEFESATPEPPLFLGAFDRVMDAIVAMQSTSSFEDLLSQMAVSVRRIAGYDRVMIYRFDPDWHGEVIAEEKREDLEPYLGLHYPASDIPAQARELYTRNLMRIIPTIDYEPVPLLSAPNGPDPHELDLSLSSLRSVSPIHIEYLRNMGVTATLVISLLDVDRSKLWGLIACHHYSPKPVRFEMRLMLAFLGQACGDQLVRGLLQERDRQQARADALIEEITSRFDPRQLPGEALCRLVGSTAVAYSDGQNLWTFGATPSLELLGRIADAARAAGGPTWATDCLADHVPGMEAIGEIASGALWAALPGRPSAWLLWLRPEQAQGVRWAGDPRKAVEVSDDGLRLSPRKSFAQWLEVIRLRSERFSDEDVEAAARLAERLA